MKCCLFFLSVENENVFFHVWTRDLLFVLLGLRLQLLPSHFSVFGPTVFKPATNLDEMNSWRITYFIYWKTFICYEI